MPTVGEAADLTIRPISPDDKGTLVEGFERLSEESRSQRFLSPHGPLSETELRYLTEVDHHDHEALLAIDSRTGQCVGVARYVRCRHEPRMAELAIAVVDARQRMGIGSQLAGALADRAREEGITMFVAFVLVDNEPMLRLASDIGRVRILHRERGTIELTVELPEQGPGRLTQLLRAAATSQVEPLPARHGTRAGSANRSP